MYVCESPYVRMRKEIAERKYVRMWNRRMYVCGKRLQKGSTHRVSNSALQQRRTDGRRYTRESWKGRRIEKGGNLFIVQAILIAGQSLTYLPLSVSAFLVFFSFYSVLENMFCIRE